MTNGCSSETIHSHKTCFSWWRHQTETFSALVQAICAGNSPVTSEFPATRPVTRSFGVSFHLRLNKRLGKQPRGWWFETPSRPLWRQSDVKPCNIPNSTCSLRAFVKSSRGIHRCQVNSPHKGQWRGALMFSLICPWKDGWVNNGKAGD